MGEKLPPKQLELYQGIDEILWKDWDPAGISHISNARDEYHSYLPVIFRMALRGASSLEIAQHLSETSQGKMGVSPNMERNMVVAQKIVQLKTKIGL